MERRRNRGGVGLLELQEIRTISLANGRAGAAGEIQEWFRRDGEYGYLEIGVTCTAVPISYRKIVAAYDAGCRRFDSAIGGLGGCPFAQDALVGNMQRRR